MMQDLDLYAVLDGHDVLDRLDKTSLFEQLSNDEGLLFGELSCYVSGPLGMPNELLDTRRLELDVDAAVAIMRRDLLTFTDNLWQLALEADLPLLFVSGGSEASYWSSAALTPTSLIRSLPFTLRTGHLAAVHPLIFASERIAMSRLAQRLSQLPSYFHHYEPQIGCMAWFAVMDNGGTGGVLEDPGLLHERALAFVNS